MRKTHINYSMGMRLCRSRSYLARGATVSTTKRQTVYEGDTTTYTITPNTPGIINNYSNTLL